ncbi:YoaK family protein [Streptomyces roseicoloratus]|uniref:YoaK family protein n=1 Tax=Streptomyces roseicoloratus TaxID=2508722 RepID=A0ABY9RUA5_9ACTN|nr:YoaK family protein [Streptomyces roseicoloratus]WMX45527.1 YoaK family protein [Streptomyces roseicoloratus]
MKPRAGGVLTAVMLVLTVTTGMIEAVSFLALGPVFTGMQTGNILLLSFALTGAAGLSPAAAGVSCGGFVIGAVLGSRLETGMDVRGRRWFGPALLGEGLLLGCAALVAWRAGIDRPAGLDGPVDGRHFAVVALLAAAMGLRNVTTLRVRVPDVPTTLSTRALAAFLGGLPQIADNRIGAGARPEVRRLASVGAMFAGGLLGAWLLHEGALPAAVLVVPGVLALALGASYCAAPARRTSDPG